MYHIHHYLKTQPPPNPWVWGPCFRGQTLVNWLNLPFLPSCKDLINAPFITSQKGKTVFGSTIELRSAKFRFLSTVTHANCIGLLSHVNGRN